MKQLGDMANVTVVTGPPAAGKSTYIRQHRQPGDITIDYDDLANTLAGLKPANHDHQPHIKHVTKAARQAAIDAAIANHDNTHTVWIIHSTPSEKLLNKYRAAGAEIITIDPGKDIVMRRIKNERPAHMAKAAGAWYSQQKPKKSRKERGYGQRHVKQRERLMRQLVDGSPCPHCGRPMYRNPEYNFDGAPLEANHSDPLANHADKQTAPLADELLHRFCNRSLGDYSRQTANPSPAPASSSGFQWGSLGNPK